MNLRRPLGLLAFACLGLAASAPALAQQVVLKVHHFLPGTSNVHVNLIQAWCDKVAKDSGDKLKCQIYPAMQLGGTPAQLFDQAKDGVADIVWTIPTYSAGRFVKSEVFELPFFTRSAKGSSQAYWAFVQKIGARRVPGRAADLPAHQRRLGLPPDATPRACARSRSSRA